MADPNAVKSRDLDGHLGDDGKTKFFPLADAKTAQDVHKAHNRPDTPVKDQCQCAHCSEYRAS